MGAAPAVASGVRPRRLRTSTAAFLDVPANRVLIVLFVASAALRVALSFAMWPTYFDTGDVWLHIAAADGDLFHNLIGPAGYAVFLRVLRPFSSSLAFPVIVQHALGLVAMGLAFNAVVRLGVSRWLCLFPAVVIGLSLDQVLIEHYLMTDAFFGFLLVMGFWLIVRAHGATRALWWLVAAGATFGAAVTVRFAGLPIVVVTVLAAVALGDGALGRRLLAGAMVVAGTLAVLVPYQVSLYASKQRLSPTASSGWMMYARAAPFADCSRFVPPRGTAHLCETSDPDGRPGFDFYAWDGGPARTTYEGDFSRANSELRAFAMAAISAQPLDYAATITRDLGRYYLPIPPARSHRDGLPMNRIGPGAPDVTFEKGMETAYEGYYDETVPTRRPRLLKLLGQLQPILRFGTPLMLGSALALVAGVVFLRGPARLWTVFAVAMSAGVLGMSAWLVGYVWRYAVPVLPFAAIAIVLAVDGVFSRRKAGLADSG